MKLRSVVFIVVGTLAGITGVAFAAASAPAPAGDSGVAMIAVVSASGLSQLGAVLYLIKLYRDKIDASAKAIPELVTALQVTGATLKTTEAAIGQHTASIQELYGSRNEHQDDLTEIRTLHEILGCKDRLKELAAELKAKAGGSHAG